MPEKKLTRRQFMIDTGLTGIAALITMAMSNSSLFRTGENKSVTDQIEDATNSGNQGNTWVEVNPQERLKEIFNRSIDEIEKSTSQIGTVLQQVDKNSSPDGKFTYICNPENDPSADLLVSTMQDVSNLRVQQNPEDQTTWTISSKKKKRFDPGTIIAMGTTAAYDGPSFILDTVAVVVIGGYLLKIAQDNSALMVDMNAHSVERRGPDLAKLIWDAVAISFSENNPNPEIRKKIVCYMGVAASGGIQAIIDMAVEIPSRSTGLTRVALVKLGVTHEGDIVHLTSIYKGFKNKPFTLDDMPWDKNSFSYEKLVEYGICENLPPSSGLLTTP